MEHDGLSSFTGVRHWSFPWARTIQSAHITCTNERHSEEISLRFAVRGPGPELECARGWAAPADLVSSVCYCCYTKRAVGTDSKTNRLIMTCSGEVQSSETLRMRSSRILNWISFYVHESRIYCCKNNQITDSKHSQKLISIISQCITRNLCRRCGLFS